MTSDKELPGRALQEMDLSAMKAFAHPLRMAMYTYLSDHGAATSTSLAQHLGESTGQTSYHLRQLERHGLVEEDTGRGTGRERWWKPVEFTVRKVFTQADNPATAPLDALLSHQLEDRVEKLRAWMGRHAEDVPAWQDAAVDSTWTALMNAEQAHALSRELMEVVDRHTAAAQHEPTSAATDEDERRVRIYISSFPLIED